MCRIFVCGFCRHVGRIVNYVTIVAAKSTDKKASEIGILINASSLNCVNFIRDHPALPIGSRKSIDDHHFQAFRVNLLRFNPTPLN